MSTLKQKIDNIIDKRVQHRLPLVRNSIAFLEGLVPKLDDIDQTIKTIKNEESAKEGPYYAMLMEDPEMKDRVNWVSTADVRKKLREHLAVLRQIEKRFSRESVQIAFVGYERQGKSRFQQSISGLGNKVIPAYNGTSCTGAVSVIHNVGEEFHAKIAFYETEEFLKMAKDKLSKFFPDRYFHINSVQDLKKADVSGFKSNNLDLCAEYDKFVETCITHIDEVTPLFGKPMLVTNDENEVVKYVAQYEIFDNIPEGEDASQFEMVPQEDNTYKYKKYYYRFVAVRSVDIYTHFPGIDDSKIELVDTVGMGTLVDNENIKNEMFRVLREECDAAVMIFRPDGSGGGFDNRQAEILCEIGHNLQSRNPKEWIYYVINKVQSGSYYNIHNVGPALNTLTSTLNKMDNPPVAKVVDIDGANPEEVNGKLVEPMLDMITNNLESIDARLVEDVNQSGMELFLEVCQLSEAVGQVISGSSEMKQNEGALFDSLEKDVTSSYFKALRKIDEEGYALSRDKVCNEVKEKIDEVILELPDMVVSPDDITSDAEMGIPMTTIFTKYANILRNDIYTHFEEVSTEVLLPLQEEVKNDLIKILYNDAMFGRIPLVSYSAESGPSVEWLRAFVNDKLSKDKYPNMRSMMMFILDYSLNIDVMIEFNVSQCLDSIDTRYCHPLTPKVTHDVDEIADYVWNELITRVVPIQNKLKVWRDDFSRIPSHSFYARVRKFREKMTAESEAVRTEIRNFYRANRLTLWNEKFAGLRMADKAFGGWNMLCKEISEACDRSKYSITVK